jgi:hypothetical protein
MPPLNLNEIKDDIWVDFDQLKEQLPQWAKPVKMSPCFQQAIV